MTLGDWATVIVTLMIGLPALYWARHEALEFREQNRLSRLDLENRGVDTSTVYVEGGTRTAKTPLRIYLPIVALGLLMVLTWAGVGVNVHNRQQNIRTDPRNIATSELAHDFVNEMKASPFPLGHFHTVCVSDESCAILAQYRDDLTNAGWTMGSVYRLANNGIYIVVSADAIVPPSQASDLRRALVNAGVDTGWYKFRGALFPELKPDDFELVVGPLK
jgi:hypothetical protein